MPDVICLKDATKRFDRIQALDGVSFALEQGEWLGLLGPNGAGKTTILRAISGHIRLDGGHVEILGTDYFGTVGASRLVGVVPQFDSLYATLSARENLEIFGAILRLSSSTLKERVAWALEWSGLTTRADDPVRTYSGGMVKRLNIACGVLHRPPIILLDEPTSHVDPQSHQRITEMLQELRSDGASLIHATNLLEEAEQHCHRVIVLDRGRVVADRSVTQLVAEMASARRRVDIMLDRRPRARDIPPGLKLEGLQLTGYISDISSELPAILSGLASAGLRVVNLRVGGPSLRSIFLDLTGRKLRD